jgi:hypothetical protein
MLTTSLSLPLSLSQSLASLSSSSVFSSASASATTFLRPLKMQLSTSLSSPTHQLAAFSVAYMTAANFLYLMRRSHIRCRPKWELWRNRTERDPGVSLRLYCAMILCWQLFVVFVFPLLEPCARLFGYVSFYYTYPNASGVGIIFEPLHAQRLTQSARARTQIRLDWHRFSYNVGKIGRDGCKHPPAVTANQPHVDMPSRGIKHWPWRRRHVYTADSGKMSKSGKIPSVFFPPS